MKSITFSALALILLLPLAACSQSGQSDASPGVADTTAQAIKDVGEKTSTTAISGEIRTAIQKAKQELASKNIDLNNIHVGNSQTNDENSRSKAGFTVQVSDSKSNSEDSRPKAEITPQGDLLIAGQKVATTPTQQALLLDYRQQIVGIAEAGMDIGAQGADLGINATKEALWGALTGKSGEDIEAAIKPQTEQIQATALQLCQRLPRLLSAQQQLATAMPEFKPYATMEQKDIKDCSKDMIDTDGKKGFAVFSD